MSERSRLRRLINRYEVDQAVFFAILARAWSFLSGPITTLLIASFFTPELQDYFYVFWFLLGMQAFFELSMDVVIVNVASHEWASLQLTPTRAIGGDDTPRRRLGALRQITGRWYLVGSIAFLVVIGVGGVWFLGQKTTLARADWIWPWLSVAVLSACQLNFLPALGLLEGCGQLPTINRVRVAQAVLGSLVVWSLIAAGAGLWAVVGSAAIRFLMDSGLIFGWYREFFASLKDRAAEGTLSWRDEIWPLQWRLGVQSIITYFSLNMFAAVMFQYHGDGVAGRMGMTWSILTALQTAAFAWVETRRPLFGELIVERRFDRLDAVFYRLTTISIVVLASGCGLFCVGLLVLRNWDWWLAQRVSERLLDPLPTLLLCVATVILQVSRCQNIYIRAHKKDPFLIPASIANGMNILLIWLLGWRFGPIGAAAGFLATVSVVIFPWWLRIWHQCRRSWHLGQPDQETGSEFGPRDEKTKIVE